MSPSAISSTDAPNPHDHVISSENCCKHQDGLISPPPSTNTESVSDASGQLQYDISRSQMSVTDVHFSQPAPDELHDLICIGFGPASLAIAISLHDKFGPLNTSGAFQPPKLCFLERQPQFAWHAGMQLPGAKMQISFLKDLATPRDPRSRFTFLNYLHHKGRFNQFINLGTFLPTRLEYEDYLRWCASHFEDAVAYNQDVASIKPADIDTTSGKVTSFSVTSRDLSSGELVTRRTRHVVIAVGGKPNIPKEFVSSPRVIHSSKFSCLAPKILDKKDEAYRVAVVGSGQSAAEIYSDLQSRYPNADVTLIIKGSALRPSDDSPFVNEIFDPDRVDKIYTQKPPNRAAAIAHDRATNYGVVRLSLLEHLYEQLYMQRVLHPNPSEHKFRILPQRFVRSSFSVTTPAEGAKVEKIELEIVGTQESDRAGEVERKVFDAVFVATGYVRDAHEDMLGGTRGLLPGGCGEEGKFEVAREYRVLFDESKVDGTKAGVWLQGCNEGTHGLSDSLLSILALRSMELVEGVFGGVGGGGRAGGLDKGEAS